MQILRRAGEASLAPQSWHSCSRAICQQYIDELSEKKGFKYAKGMKSFVYYKGVLNKSSTKFKFMMSQD